MGIGEGAAIFAAGAAAGGLNAIVGSGTLITFPVLLAFGYAPVTANVSNTVGLVPGSVSSSHGYRSQLAGQGRRMLGFGAASVAGGLTGSVLLLTLPPSVFEAVVPVLIAIALVLVLVQPWISSRLAVRRRSGERGSRVWLPVALFLIGVYGGYFGAAQGILLLSVLGIALPVGLGRVNGLKNVLAGATNTVAALVFVLVADVAWGAALLIAAGSILGGQVGARIGLRLPDWALRLTIVFVGAAAIAKLALA